MRTAVVRSLPIVLAVLVLWATPVAADDHDVRTSAGVVRGLSQLSTTAFLGIPYAQPPTGALRWKAPQPFKSWQSPLDAKVFGPTCIQLGGPPNSSEDCLTLNIWVPSGARSGNLPVMVWIHGGHFLLMSGSDFDGAALARQGVIVVTFNYRLGYFGFFAHPELLSEHKDQIANFGLLDQIAALKWIKDHIAAFGGDPNRVTIFGQSAGGKSVLELLSSALARGLFQQAIVQSAGAWWPQRTLVGATREGVEVADALGFAGHSASPDELRAVPSQQVAQVTETRQPRVDFGPIVGDVALPVSSVAALGGNTEAAVPLLVGANSYEGPFMGFFGRQASDVFQSLRADRAEIEQKYPAGLEPTYLAELIWGDMNFVAPARWVAARHSAVAPVWLYHFSYVRVADRPRKRGAGHGDELDFLLGEVDATAEEDRHVAEKMRACWVSFAKLGRPECDGSTLWPAYRPSIDQTMEIGGKLMLRQGLYADRLDALTKFFQKTGAVE